MPKSAKSSWTSSRPTALGEPGGLLAGGEAEGDAGVEGKGRVLADVVVARGVADLDRALLHGVHHLEARYDFSEGIDPQAKIAFGHRLQAFGEHFGGSEDGVEAAGEARGESPSDLLTGDDRRGSTPLGVSFAAGGHSASARQAHQTLLEKLSAIHRKLSNQK